MSTRDNSLLLIGGNSPLLLASVKKGGEPMPPKDYSVEMYIARHGNTLSDSPKNGCIAKFYYDRSLRKLRAVIPKKQSLDMVGHFVYHYGVTTPTGTEFRPEYGNINFIQGMED